MSHLGVVLGTELVACVLILTGVAMSYEKHGLLQATVLQFAYKLMKKEAFFKLSCVRVYRSISVCVHNSRSWSSHKCRWVKSVAAEWESSVEKPRKRKESLRKYQLEGEKLAKSYVVLLFGLYLATSSVIGECLRTVQECSLRAPLGGREDAFMPLAQRQEVQRHQVICQRLQGYIFELGNRPRYPDTRSTARRMVYV